MDPIAVVAGLVQTGLYIDFCAFSRYIHPDDAATVVAPTS